MRFFSAVLSTLDRVTADRARALVEDMETGKAANEFDFFLRVKTFEAPRQPPSLRQDTRAG